MEKSAKLFATIAARAKKAIIVSLVLTILFLLNFSFHTLVVTTVRAQEETKENQKAIQNERQSQPPVVNVVGDREEYTKNVIHEITDKVKQPAVDEQAIKSGGLFEMLLGEGAGNVRIMRHEDQELPKPPPIPKIPQLPSKIISVPQRLPHEMPRAPRAPQQQVEQPPVVRPAIPQIPPLPRNVYPPRTSSAHAVRSEKSDEK